jgi:hypothetical protein
LARLLSGDDPPDRSVRSRSRHDPVDSSTQVHAAQEDDGEIESRSQTGRDDIENENLDCS